MEQHGTTPDVGRELTLAGMDHGLSFEEVAAALHRGDFSWLAPIFPQTAEENSALVQWVRESRFAADPAALHEAATCACFLGRTDLVHFLMDHGADPIAGMETGLNGFHWAANRGHLDTVQALIARRLPMEIRNCYGGTVLGASVWAAVHEPKAAHLSIIAALLNAGADAREAESPSGSEVVDQLLRRFGANPESGPAPDRLG